MCIVIKFRVVFSLCVSFGGYSYEGVAVNTTSGAAAARCALLSTRGDCKHELSLMSLRFRYATQGIQPASLS